MAVEIERKYLITEPISHLPTGEDRRIVQAYLQCDPKRTVRVRISGETGFLTIKGESNNFSRLEFEYEIPLKEAEAMIEMSVTTPIYKIRRVVIFEGKRWEIDIFHKENSGLVVAEIELDSEEETFTLPPWIAYEVTGDKRFYNSQLSISPYSEWKEISIK